MRSKTPAWQRFEAETKLRDLTHHLEISLLQQEEPKPIVQLQTRLSPAGRAKTLMVLAVLVGLIGLAVLLAIGTGSVPFYFSLTLHLW